MPGSKEVYREHEIMWDVNLEAHSGLWKATGEILFPHEASLPKVALPISDSDRFIMADEARAFILSKAKSWIDDRVNSRR